MQAAIILFCSIITERYGQFVQFMLPMSNFRKDGEHLFPQGIVWKKIRVLGKITDTGVTRNGYCAFFRLFISGKKIQQSSFTGTIWTNKSNTIIFIDLKSHP